jgi:hypothetical protein
MKGLNISEFPCRSWRSWTLNRSHSVAMSRTLAGYEALLAPGTSTTRTVPCPNPSLSAPIGAGQAQSPQAWSDEFVDCSGRIGASCSCRQVWTRSDGDTSAVSRFGNNAIQAGTTPRRATKRPMRASLLPVLRLRQRTVISRVLSTWKNTDITGAAAQDYSPVRSDKPSATCGQGTKLPTVVSCSVVIVCECAVVRSVELPTVPGGILDVSVGHIGAIRHRQVAECSARRLQRPCRARPADRPWSRRTGVPEASATGRDRNPPMLTRLLTGRATTPRDERVQDGTTLWHPPSVKAC